MRVPPRLHEDTLRVRENILRDIKILKIQFLWFTALFSMSIVVCI
jgi:hypothetical protein